MKHRTLGKTGFEISEIGFGAWAIGGDWGEQSDKESIEALNVAIDKGVNFIDTAAGYGHGKSEKLIAEVLKQRKERVYVATKIPPTNGPWPPSPYCDVDERYPETYLKMALNYRLKFLQTDSIDLLQLHTWTRAWNKNPRPFETLKEFKKQGKIKAIGISTPEHDQNAVIDLIRGGYVDVVQVIYNIFEQEPAAELLPVALEHNVGVIVRVAFDEGVLTGKYEKDHRFPDDDFRSKYFAGDRLNRAIDRVNKIKKDFEGLDFTMPQLALKYPLSHPAVSTVISGIRNKDQAIKNIDVSDMSELSDEVLVELQNHAWLRAFWYSGT